MAGRRWLAKSFMSAEGLEFVDTNVLVYAFDLSAREKHATASQLIERLWGGGNGCLSVQVLQEFFVTVTRKVKQPLPVSEARDRVRELSVWRVMTPNATDVLDWSAPIREDGLARIRRLSGQVDFGTEGGRSPTGVPKSRADGSRGHVSDRRVRSLLIVPAPIYG
jgi:predicted nucleic acid-binding protein